MEKSVKRPVGRKIDTFDTYVTAISVRISVTYVNLMCQATTTHTSKIQLSPHALAIKSDMCILRKRQLLCI
jgi:hypothetical protein